VRKKKRFYPIIITILLFLAIYLLSRLISDESLRSLIDGAGTFGPLIVILLALVANIIAPLSSSPIILVGYYAYGRNVIFLISIAALISFATNFLISRRYGRSLVEKFAGKESMKKVDDLTKKYGLVTLFFLRIFQGAIHDIISYAAGLTSMKFSAYYAVSAVALIFHALIWYYFSLSADNPISFLALTALITFLLSFFFILFTWASIKMRVRKD